MTTRARGLFRLFALSLALAGAAAAETPPLLSVRGEAVLAVSPDQVSIDLGVTTRAETAREALSANNAAMRRVIGQLRELGLGEQELQTRQFRIHPLWSQRPAEPGPEWQAHIVGYRVSNSLLVQTVKIALAGDIIGTATDAGANQVNGILFGLSDPRQHRGTAIAQATANAAADAQALARAANVKILGIARITLDNAVASPVQMQEINFRSAAQDAGAPPIQAGDVSVSASVSVDYRVE